MAIERGRQKEREREGAPGLVGRRGGQEGQEAAGGRGQKACQGRGDSKGAPRSAAKKTSFNAPITVKQSLRLGREQL